MGAYAYVGCYTSPDRGGHGRGIDVYEVNQPSGAWRHVQLVESIGNPSWQTIAGHRLYSVHGGDGLRHVSAYAIDPTSGRLTLLNTVECGSPNPVAIAVSPTAPYAVVAGYAAGVLASLPVWEDGSLGPVADLVALPGDPGPHPIEQDHSRPHHVVFDATGLRVVVPDKGVDRTHVYELDPVSGALTPTAAGPASARVGAAPRHLAFHPHGRIAYQCNEIDDTLTTFAYDTATGALADIDVQSTLPETFTGLNGTAEVHVGPSGRFVYVSNRGHDSVAIFAVDAATGRLSPVGWEPTQGREPRYFGLTPDGTLLYAANQATHTIITFRVGQELGTLHPTGQVLETGSPACITFAGDWPRFG